MERLRPFIKRHLLWFSLLAALLPLACLLWLQYRSLAKLERSSAVEFTVSMKTFLNDVQKEVKYFYKGQAEETLTTWASSLTPENLETKKDLFGKCQVDGAKRLFVVAFNGQDEARTYFYEPREAFRNSPPVTAELEAVNVAVAPFKIMSEKGSTFREPMLTSDERANENHILFKPIINAERKVVGITGMILDAGYFKTTLLPETVNTSLAKFFPDDGTNKVAVGIYDNFATAKGPRRADEIYIGMPHFSDWAVGIRSRDMTPEQWAHWNFKYNFALSVLLTLVLLGGVVLILRTAAREMRLSQMKADFVSNVSHELRTPLASIRVFGEFMKLGRVRDDAKIHEYGAYIETESRRLTQLINNILDFSRIESGRKTYEYEPSDLSALVCATLQTCEIQLDQSGFEVELEKPVQPLPPVLLDTDAISQAFLNLLDNAVKYSGASHQIKVKLDERDGFARVAVTDYGVGIPHAEQSKIFAKFYRVSTGLVHDVKGSGLGLALVKHIVEAHQGKITVDSEPEQGSTFTLHLPAAVPQTV